MKTKFIFILLLFFSFINCSEDEVETLDTAPEIKLTRCFTVKELGTDAAIENARVVLLGPTICSGVGCGPTVFGLKFTDSNGDVCFDLTEENNENIKQILCNADGYFPYEINNPELNFSEIYLEPR